MTIAPPTTSSSLNTTCATCLRKFTIHFRREYSEFTPANYQGEFGFDWLRDEYIYPMLRLDDGSYHKIYSLNRPLDLPRLKKIYTDHTILINPHGIEYIPSFLTLFSEKFLKKKRYEIIKSEISLNLEIHQISGDESTLDTSDSTEIEFISSDKNLLISLGGRDNYQQKVKCRLLDLASDGQKTKMLDQNNNISRKYYIKKQFFYIKSKGNGHKVDATIEVFANKGGIREKVGILCIKQNYNVKKSNFKMIKIIGDSNPVNILPNIQKILKEQSLNQALVDVTVDPIEMFDIRSMSVKDNDALSFINDFYGSAILNNNNEMSFDSSRIDDFITRLMALYEKHKKLKYKINSDDNKSTYIFCTNLVAQNYDANGNEMVDSEILGSATYEHERGYSSEQWGNMIVIFRSGLQDKITYLHEIGHTFKLHHVFESGQNFEFLHGFTDNIMDYDYIETSPFRQVVDSPYLNSQFSLFRWQWDIINSDRSAR